MKRLGRWMTWALLLSGFAGLLLLPQTAAEGVREGLELCAGTVVPALFPFLVLSSAAVSLGAADTLGVVLAPLMGPLFRCGRAGAAALGLGLMGGYPVGAKTVRSLYEGGHCSRQEAERLLGFCNCCGPAFILGTAGMLGSAALGGILLAGHWLGALTTGIVFRIFGKKDEKLPPSTPIRAQRLSNVLTEAVRGTLSALGNICAYVVLFQVFSRLLEEAGALSPVNAFPNGRALVLGLLDLTGGVTAVDPTQSGAIELTAFLLGIGGLSVLCQTMAVLDGSGLALWPAAVGKLLHGIFGALWTHVLLLWVPLPEQSMAVISAGRSKPSLAWFPVSAAAASWGTFCLILSVFITIRSSKTGQRRV